VRLVGTIMDITARKGLEDQFLQSQRLETVGRLAGAVAHDFNNVLTVINGYSDLLLADLKENDPDRSSLEAIRQAGERASGITRQLLTFSRKHASDPRVVSLGAAVREVERMARGVLREAISLAIELDAVDDAVFIDPAHLHQVLMNLIVNARDAMPNGGTLRIATSREDLSDGRGDVEPGRYVCLTVVDTGTGMDAATLGRIFEPFFTTKEQGRGTGLGLSTVHGIITQAGGCIRVQSTPGAGTTFRLYLPPAPADASEPVSLVVPVALERGSGTILVAEDQEDVRDVTVAVLRGAGYAVLAAADGAQAIQISARHEGPIDLLLTDVIMPGMDGKSLAEALGASRPDLRVLYTSGYTDDVLGAHDIEHTHAGYLAKPFSPDGLLAAVRDVLGPRESRPTVLIVDDDADVRRLFGEALADRYAVLLACDGLQAVETVRTAARVDLVLIDLFMPRQDGTQTIQALREIAPQLPIVAISGAFGGQFLPAAERTGVAATLAKPVSLDTLRKLVEKLCPTRTSTDR
jgi:CheY-like chemotaxis protein/nitrogen-specific signal transduction histidine kinase